MAESVVKKRRVTKKDWQKVEEFIKKELDSRQKSQFRRSHEERWKEVDRQLAMEPMVRVDTSGNTLPKSWHNVLELGELSKASEVITADVMRITFPQDRIWFEPHVESPEKIVTAVGVPVGATSQDEIQGTGDGVLRSMMSQQHLDFGFKARVELLVKEALHHGSFCATVRLQAEKMTKEGRIGKVQAPVIVPYSMWNSYPDPSPSVIPTGLFYTGSMMLVDYMPLWKLKQMSGEGWMAGNFSRVTKKEHQDKDNVTHDVQLVRYFGDLNMERDDGDMFIPNVEVITANGVVVYFKESDFAHPPVIFDGYERQDIRDPYYTSPLIKQSPMQKVTTVCANKFLDITALQAEPPCEYDGNDPDYVMNGGPTVAPGAKTPTRSMGKGANFLQVGDSTPVLNAMQFGFRQMQEGLGVSSLRQGIPNSDRQTATEIVKTTQGAEVRTVDFVAKLESRALRPFLYMQHDMNRRTLDNYAFYNSEIGTRDFLRLSRKEVDFFAHFDIVGSRGVLGEEQRTQKIFNVTTVFSGNPLFAPKLKVKEIMLDAYRDAGKKNPEEFVQVETPKIPPEVEQRMAQMAQALQKQQDELTKLRSTREVDLADIATKRQQIEATHATNMAELAQKKAEAERGSRQEAMELVERINSENKALAEEHRKNTLDFKAAMAAVEERHATAMTELRADMARHADEMRVEREDRAKPKPKRSRKITPETGADGRRSYRIEDLN